MNLDQMIDERLKLAQICRLRYHNGIRRLEKFPLLARVFLYWRFNGMREIIKQWQWSMFSHTCVLMALQRTRKEQRRASA